MIKSIYGRDIIQNAIESIEECKKDAIDQSDEKRKEQGNFHLSLRAGVWQSHSQRLAESVKLTLIVKRFGW